MRRLLIASYITLIYLVAAGANLGCYAQEGAGDRAIETDRDSFTPALTTVEQRRFMVESAWTFVDNKQVADTHSLPELLLRYGLSDWLEVRFGANYEVGGESNAVSAGATLSEAASTSGLAEESNVSYGLKAQLSKQNGWLPLSALTVTGSTPTSGEEVATSLVSSYVLGWELENRVTLASSIRYGTGVAEEVHFNSWAPSAVIKAPLFENVNVHAEYFGIFSDGKERESVRHFFSPGVHYLVSPDFEIGIRTGWGLNHQSANFFSNIGFGWQY